MRTTRSQTHSALHRPLAARLRARARGQQVRLDGQRAVAFDKVPEGSGRMAALVKVVFQMMFFGASLATKSLLLGIRTNFIFGTSLMNNEVSHADYVDFLPSALASGAFVAAPEAHVIGSGLGQVQAAFDLQRKGMSAKKVVVGLEGPYPIV